MKKEHSLFHRKIEISCFYIYQLLLNCTKFYRNLLKNTQQSIGYTKTALTFRLPKLVWYVV